MCLVPAGPIIEPIVRVEHTVPDKLEQTTVQLVGAGLIHQIDDAAARSPKLGSEVAALHFELLDRIHRGCKTGSIRGRRVYRNPVDQRFVSKRLAAVHRKVSTGVGIGACWKIAKLTQRLGSGCQRDQRERIPPGQRKLDDFAIVYHLAQRRRRWLQ